MELSAAGAVAELGVARSVPFAGGCAVVMVELCVCVLEVADHRGKAEYVCIVFVVVAGREVVLE